MVAPALLTLELAGGAGFLGVVGLSVFVKLTVLVPCTGAVRRGLPRRDVMFVMVLGCLVLWSGIEVDGLNRVQTIKRACCRVQTGIDCRALNEIERANRLRTSRVSRVCCLLFWS